MNLPDLDWQWLYSRFAWGIVLAALLLRAGARWAAPAPGATAIAAVIAFAAMWLPGAASAAYWLGLMFQYPSVMLVVCLLLPLLLPDPDRRAATPLPGSEPAQPDSTVTGKPHLPESSARPQSPMNPRLALVLALGGAWLYADSFGWLSTGLYGLGFDPRWAPAAALLAGAWAVWALRSVTLRATGLVVLACVVVFCLARLPSGNLFDAFVDPWLWAWSVCATVRASWRRLRSAPPAAGVEHAPTA
jgi:hypothetical protein